MTMMQDLTNRSPDIAWPDRFEPESADLFAHNAITIGAVPAAVWPHIVAATAWPDWFPRASAVSITDGGEILTPDSRFTWTIFGMAIESRVHAFVPARRLGWFGLGPDGEPAFAVEWHLAEIGDGCRVVLEEAGVGAAAAAFRISDEGALHDAHEVCLRALQDRVRPR